MPTGHYERILTDVDERFDAKVNKNGPTQPHMKTCCWVWTGSKVRGGYGNFRAVSKEQPVYAHRFAIERVKGKSALDVLHRCDNPSCVRPSHLRYGTELENMGDCIKRGRRQNAKGVNNPAARMTESKVRAIRQSRLTQTALAKKYGISQAAIGYIINRKTWKHVV
jgi:hypothetical protein